MIKSKAWALTAHQKENRPRKTKGRQGVEGVIEVAIATESPWYHKGTETAPPVTTVEISVPRMYLGKVPEGFKDPLYLAHEDEIKRKKKR